ncbi:MAG: MarR family winged helix-turn-helix transcriptional regulator [Fimbriimonadaceae bacterium]|nr:MarR family winged helix-turn-helix transcriptional regulator [Fimbriimonadaceae bacterium]
MAGRHRLGESLNGTTTCDITTRGACVMRPPDDTVTEHATALTHAVADAIEPTLVLAQVTPSQFDILAAISRPQPPSQAEVCAQLHLSPASLSEALQPLLDRQLVQRTGDTQDRRVKRLRLSAQGERLVRQVLRVVREVERLATSDLPPEDVAITIRTLRRMNENLLIAVETAPSEG